MTKENAEVWPNHSESKKPDSRSSGEKVTPEKRHERQELHERIANVDGRVAERRLDRALQRLDEKEQLLQLMVNSRAFGSDILSAEDRTTIKGFLAENPEFIGRLRHVCFLILKKRIRGNELADKIERGLVQASFVKPFYRGDKEGLIHAIERDEQEFAPLRHSVYLNERKDIDRREREEPEVLAQLTRLRQEIGALVASDAEVRRLCEEVRREPSGHRIAALLAVIRKNVEMVRYDLPGWEGNMFDHGDIVRVDKYVQWACPMEWRAIRLILEIMQERGFLPKEYQMHEVIAHWHQSVCIIPHDDREPFILDMWVSRVGEPVPVYYSCEEWRKKTAEYASRDSLMRQEEQRKFSQSSFDEAKRGDQGFYERWVLEHEKDKSNVFRKMHAFDTLWFEHGSEEMKQDYVMCKYFLGSHPLLPSDQLQPYVFESFRDRIATMVDRDTTGKVLRCRTFRELEPFASQYFKKYYSSSDLVKNRLSMK